MGIAVSSERNPRVFNDSGGILKRCITCGKNTKDFAEFPCPQCDERIVRCHYCRENRNKYASQCGFTGP